MTYDYDLAIIGAGSGGLVAAELAADLGARVLLVEARQGLGGECLHSGCVPSKALISAARAAAGAKKAARLGITMAVSVDFSKVMEHVRSSIEAVEKRSDNDGYYQAKGVEVIHGYAKFCGSNELAVNKKRLSAKNIIIATGSSPLIPPIPGLELIKFQTNETIFQLTELPKRLAVIGGGPIGVELGQAFAMLGSAVTILAREDRLLPREEPEASEAHLDSLKQQGVNIVLGVAIGSAEAAGRGVRINYTAGSHAYSVEANTLLIATGRRANTDLDLSAAGVNPGERGITVDKQMRTNVRNIFAIGDCNGGPQFTHAAAAQAKIAVQNALYGLKRNLDLSQIPWATFTTPEIAHFGATEASLESKHFVKMLDYSHIDRAVAEDQAGFIKIFTDSRDVILGATIVGQQASELIAQLSLAAQNGLTFAQLGGCIQAYPTYSTGLAELAARDNLASFQAGQKGRLARAWLKLRQ